MDKTYWDKNCGKQYQYCEERDIDFVCDLIIGECQSVFETATGSGIFPTVLRKKGFSGKYLGSDYCEIFLEGAKENNPQEEFIEVDLRKPINLPDKSFDCIVIHHGLEYFYPHELAFTEFKRIANKYVFLIMWQDFGESNSIRFCVEHNWQVNFYSRKEFNKMLNKLGMKIVLVATITNDNNKINYLYVIKV